MAGADHAVSSRPGDRLCRLSVSVSLAKSRRLMAAHQSRPDEQRPGTDAPAELECDPVPNYRDDFRIAEACRADLCRYGRRASAGHDERGTHVVGFDGPLA